MEKMKFSMAEIAHLQRIKGRSDGNVTVDAAFAHKLVDCAQEALRSGYATPDFSASAGNASGEA